MKGTENQKPDDSDICVDLYRDLIEASQDLFWQCDEAGRYRYLNAEWETVLGYRVEEMLGRKFTDFQSPGAAKADIAVFAELLAGRSVKGHETVHLTKSGNAVHLSFNAKPLVNRLGKVLGTVGTAMDITARKRMEDTLRQNEERFRNLFMSISDGFYLSEIIRDEDGVPFDYRFVEINPTFEKIVGLSKDKIIGRRYREIVPADTTKWMGNYRRVAETGLPSTFEFYSSVYRKSFETYAYKTGETHITVFVRDVTERKKTERALQRVEKLESLGLLAGGIAHDFNNLLGSIFANIEMARETAQHNEPTLRYLDAALHSFKRAQSLTRQMLTFAKGGEPVRTVGSLASLLRESAGFALSGSSITCAFDISENLSACSFDADQMAQVVDNLVINAVQAMPDGGHIRISARNTTLATGEHRDMKAGKYIRVAFADSGSGIPMEIQTKIFDPFFTTKPTGTGLGLTTVYSIVKKHGGMLNVQQAAEGGAEFVFYLPAANTPIEEKKPHVAAIETFPIGRGRILVMDDDRSLRAVLRRMLESAGYAVDTAAEGRIAERMLREADVAGEAYTAVLLDLTVPGGVGGKECVARIRRSFRDLPIFVASGYSDDPVMANPIAFGFTDKIQKPFLKKELLAMLARHSL